jgi:CBS domain-containing protein
MEAWAARKPFPPADLRALTSLEKCFAPPPRGVVFWFPFLNGMDVSGHIGAILNQKSGEVFSIGPDATVFKAIEMMADKNVGALLVMKGEELVGIISERDYTRKVFLHGKSSKETRVDEIMSKDVTVTHPQQGVDECLRMMTDKHIRHLPVVDGDSVVGVISIGDLVKHVISCQSAAIAHLEDYIHGGYRG